MPHGFAVGDSVRFHPISRMIDMARGPYMGGDAGDDAFCPSAMAYLLLTGVLRFTKYAVIIKLLYCIHLYPPGTAQRPRRRCRNNPSAFWRRR